MKKRIIYPQNKDFWKKLERINRKKPIRKERIEVVIEHFMLKKPSFIGIQKEPFFHVKTRCFVKFRVLEDHIKVIAVSCSKKGFGS